ncbi:TPA: hypothetical protein ACQN03_001422 [Streptococcus pyogenes]|nr:hypothetical protein [Streptococcus pyogenes]HEQ8777871.1 hypothetical protein [Streptococcus pyogenes]HEQ9313465.1 hypothetical protein [Streptococcus pyogenes]
MIKEYRDKFLNEDAVAQLNLLSGERDLSKIIYLVKKRGIIDKRNLIYLYRDNFEEIGGC